MTNFTEEVKRLLHEGKIPPHKFESSKHINFLLTYNCEQGKILDQAVDNVIRELEEWEDQTPKLGTEKPHRKKRRRHDTNRRFKIAVRAILLNLFQLSEVRDTNVYLAISLDANTYGLKKRYSPPDMTYDPVIDAFNGLRELRYIKIKHKGFWDAKEGNGLSTRITASSSLLSLYEEAKGKYHPQFINRRFTLQDKDELIILKGKLPGTQGMVGKLSYADNTFTTRARSRLKRINNTLSKHNLKLNCDKPTYSKLLAAMRNKQEEDPDQLSYIDESTNRLYRIFSEGRFDRGGRFYRCWWQQIPKEYRKYITIDEQPTAELDYSRLHISIAYSQMGITPPTDPYDIHPRDKGQEMAKFAINAMLNAKAIVRPHPRYNAKSFGMTWKQFIKRIEEFHSPIVKNAMWANSYGLTLQFLESELAEEIMLHFSKQDIPCLPIHDSFIVPAKYKEELGRIMVESYQDKFHQEIKIKERE